MFSGIVENTAEVVSVTVTEGDNLRFRMRSAIAEELSIDQSVSHNGVCLTVVKVNDDSTYEVTAIRETLDRSNLGLLRVGDEVNLERSMKLNDRLDGHIVQGHVDTTAECVDIEEREGSKYFKFRYSVSEAMRKRGYLTVEKGSVSVNGVSLTVCDAERDSFRVAIIPYTMEHTNFHCFKVGSVVNIEFDIIGKYLAGMMS